MATAVETRGVRIFMRVAAALVLAFLYVPLAVIFLYAFNSAVGQKWPPASLTTRWFGVAWRNKEIRAAFLTSVKAAMEGCFSLQDLGSKNCV